MEQHQAQAEIERILDQVHSLDDLSVDDIIELRNASEQSIVLDKFKISPTQYHDWLSNVAGGESVRGMEYDAQNACIVLKGRPGLTHEAATSVVHVFLDRIREKLETATGSFYFLTGSKDCQLDSEFTGSVKQADASLKKSKTGWPVIVLEVGVSEATKKLHEYARRWLEGSCGQTKLVMLVDIQEQGRRNTSNDKWELSETDFCNYSTLYTRILQWYRSREFRLVGSFRLSVHFWYSDGDRQCVLNQAEFSPNSLIDPTTIQDVPLRLDYLIPDGSDLDTGEPLLFPLQHLVRTLQNGFEDIEIDRAQLLAREEMKKYRSL